MVDVNEYFDFNFTDDQLVEQFQDFLNSNNLDPLFTDAYRTGNITVPWSMVRSAVNPGGAYNRDLTKLGDYITWDSNNKAYEMAMFKIIYNARTMKNFMQRVRAVNRLIETEIQMDHQFNRWNIVFYHKDLF